MKPLDFPSHNDYVVLTTKKTREELEHTVRGKVTLEDYARGILIQDEDKYSRQFMDPLVLIFEQPNGKIGFQISEGKQEHALIKAQNNLPYGAKSISDPVFAPYGHYPKSADSTASQDLIWARHQNI